MSLVWDRDVASRGSSGRRTFLRALSASLPYVAIALPLFVLLAWPLLTLAAGAFRTASPLEPGAAWTFGNFARMWAEINVSGALLNSLAYAGLTTLFAVTMALGLCFLSERTDVAFRRLITPMMIVCAATSTLFYAIGYSLLANRYTGALNVLAQAAFGLPPLVNIESWWGLIFVDSLHSAAFLYLFLVGPFRNMDRSLEEAALVAGASRLRTFLSVNVRLLTPIISSVVLMGIVFGLKSFNIPLILGTPADLSFLTVGILRNLQAFQPPQYGEASALALSLIGVIALLLLVQRRVIGRGSYSTVTGKSFRQTRWALGLWRWPATALVLTYMLLAVVLPLGAVVLSSFVPFPGSYRNFSLVNYHALFANPDMSGLLANTALGAAIAGFVGVAIAFTIAYLTQRSNSRVGQLLRGLTQLQLAMPGIVGSLALIWAFTLVPGLRQIYGTIWLLMIAFVVAVLPVSVQIASGAVRQLARELEEAARISGASPLRGALQITVRLLLPSLLFAWLLAAITITGDLDAPLLLSSAGTRTMSIQIYKLFDGVDQSQAAALLSLMLAFVLAAASLYALLSWVTGSRAWRTAGKLS
jgi:iron(III) transport system permease protein